MLRCRTMQRTALGERENVPLREIFDGIQTPMKEFSLEIAVFFA